jgi:hypothetical protein
MLKYIRWLEERGRKWQLTMLCTLMNVGSR